MLTADSESLLRLAEIEGRGRALVACRPLRAGEIVLKDSPILVYSAFPLIKPESSASASASYCDNCFRTLPLSENESLRSCQSCSHHHRCCSPNCLAIATATSHSPWVCQALSRLRDCPSLLSQSIENQLKARFLVAAYNLALVSSSHFQALLSLQGQGSPSDVPAVQFLHSVIASLCPPSLSMSVELTAALLSKDKLNAFGLMESISLQKNGERSVRAYGIYPKACLFNHDCLPNACRFDYIDSATDQNTDIIIRMIHDVPEGREICLSYFPVNLNYSSRQKRLAEDYGFSCDCDRCKVEANWSDNEADVIDDSENFEEEQEEAMDEDSDEQMIASDTENGATAGDADFPHAYFFLRYMCSHENCWGTLAPLPPSNDAPSKVLECNVCGNLKNEEDVC